MSVFIITSNQLHYVVALGVMSLVWHSRWRYYASPKLNYLPVNMDEHTWRPQSYFQIIYFINC